MTKSGIAGRLETIEGAEQGFGIRRMQTRRRLVQHVDNAEEIRLDLGCEAEPLQLARRKGRRAAIEREIAQSQIEQNRQT